PTNGAKIEFCPATKPTVALSIWAPRNPPPKNPLWLICHDAPESVEWRISCESPPQIPFVPLNETDLRLSSTPLAMLCHVAPPSVVRRIVPLSPTAIPSLGSRK